MEKYELNKLIDEYKVKIADLNTALAISLKQPLYRKLEEEMNDPFFWQDQEKAQKVIAKANALKEVLTAYTKLENRFQDFLSLAEMALEDEEAMLLLDEEAKLLQQETDLLEEKALLSQKYDDADCILELHPGAGGTESMDWADMLFRMYQRFASRKGFRFNILIIKPAKKRESNPLRFRFKEKTRTDCLNPSAAFIVWCGYRRLIPMPEDTPLSFRSMSRRKWMRPKTS